jgi:hypothetical protein
MARILKIRCESTDLFDISWESAVKIAADNQCKAFVVFYGAANPETNISWCPDCTTAEPIIEMALENLNADARATPYCSVLVECTVVKEEYRSLGAFEGIPYPYKTRPEINIKCIPTLMKLTPDGPTESLADPALQEIAKVQAFVSS